MKVTSIENPDYEVVRFENLIYRRYPNGQWTDIYGREKIICNQKNFEDAYQKFKNPPYTIEVIYKGSLAYFVVRIKNITLFSYNFTQLEIESKKQELEQALDSLMGEKC